MKTKIKICGLVSADDAALVNGFDIDFAGIVLFYPKSRRNRTSAEAEKILAALRPEIKKVAVVVAPSAREIAGIVSLGFDYIQIHGDLTKEALAAARLPILRAFHAGGIPQSASYTDSPKIAGYVFDAPQPGSGKTFDWNLLQTVPLVKCRQKPFLLAGGLTPGNVAEAVRLIHPHGVDVSSSVEYDGRIGKDPEKVAAFVRAVEECGKRAD